MSQILALTNSGQPHAWMTWQDAVVNLVKGNVAWSIGDHKDIKRGGVSRMTGLRSEVEIAPIIALKGHFKYNTATPALTNHNLFARDRQICGYCGKFTREERLSKDHIIPTSKGGKNIWTNVISACKPCNHAKDDMTPEEAGMPLLFVPYIPNHFEKLILKGRNILPIQMEFLKDFLPVHSRLLH